MSKHALTVMDKQSIKEKLIDLLQNDLLAAKQAAQNAHLAAIDDQSVAETQYDTLAIEASYLAEGHSKRIHDLKVAIERANQIPVCYADKVGLGALVKLYSQTIYYYLAPCGGGLKFNIEDNYIVTVTPQSPVGRALINKILGDEINIQLPDHQLTDDIELLF